MKHLFLFGLFLGLLDPACTLEKICTAGYTRTVRPPASYTNVLKKQQMSLLKLPGDASQYEEDHVIPLELCGHPTDARNLTPEFWPRARKKDVQETKFHRAVCQGQMKLEEAQKQVAGFE